MSDANRVLTGAKLAAALAELIYRRNQFAEPLAFFDDLGMELPPDLPTNVGTNLRLRDDLYYYPIIDNRQRVQPHRQTGSDHVFRE